LFLHAGIGKKLERGYSPEKNSKKKKNKKPGGTPKAL
jgi:hypothetical protein